MILVNTLRKRRLRFKPKLGTSLRSHGKWGDLLACIIPISWCANILINSNFLLKLIEWQNESSLFTLRIRGKQWYWVYKLDFKNFTNIITAPKNIGHNKWVLYGHNNIRQSDDYLSSLQLRKQVKLVSEYWNNIISKDDWENKPKNSTIYDTISNKIELKFSNFRFTKLLNNYTSKSKFLYSIPDSKLFASGKFNFFSKSLFDISLVTSKPINLVPRWSKSYSQTSLAFPNINNLYKYVSSNSVFSTQDNILQKSSTSYYDDTNRFSRSREVSKVFSIKRSHINDDFIKAYSSSGDDQLKLKFINLDFTGIHDRIESKIKPHNNFMVLKQKRYKRRKSLKDSEIILPKKSLNYYIKNNISAPNKGQLLLNSNNSTEYLTNNFTSKYKMFMKNKIKSDNSNIAVNRRMLRTKRTLIIPAHVNITAITNSYDVIHSWFIPGLGLKMDCIPGRSTHHTFFIDNVGFYYGQCAEVCGRYHHHMPIRICALPFDHFLLWWYHFGAPKFLPTNFSKRNNTNYNLRKYTW